MGANVGIEGPRAIIICQCGDEGTREMPIDEARDAVRTMNKRGYKRGHRKGVKPVDG